MAQFDVYRNPNRSAAGAIPFLLDVQSGFLSDLATRVVVPLAKANDAAKPMRRLNPRLRVEAREVVMMTDWMAAVPVAALGAPVASLAASRDDIIAALDFLITGI